MIDARQNEPNDSSVWQHSKDITKILLTNDGHFKVTGVEQEMRCVLWWLRTQGHVSVFVRQPIILGDALGMISE